MDIGRYREQPQGFKAFIPNSFPLKEDHFFSPEIVQKHTRAILLLGKLDGITQLLPDVDFFLFMYIRKDAASSSQIEGTKATMIDVIEAESQTNDKLPDDVDDIIHYISALNYGLERLRKFPLSLRFIREIHKELMTGARSSHYSNPGNFRTSQNWIGGTNPGNASFVPPPVYEMGEALGDLERYMNTQDSTLPLIKAALIHAQFETIHPFLDGNGRTGRVLITLFLWLERLLDRPVLFLSSYFRRYQQIYYDRLNDYHSGDPEAWFHFFLDGIIQISLESIDTVRKITELRERDVKKINELGKTASKSAVKVLPQLFKLPIVNVAMIQKWTGFTRQGAQKIIDRFVDLKILYQKNVNKKYDRSFIYRDYVDIFED